VRQRGEGVLKKKEGDVSDRRKGPACNEHSRPLAYSSLLFSLLAPFLVENGA
jgi:hypothetical protein